MSAAKQDWSQRRRRVPSFHVSSADRGSELTRKLDEGTINHLAFTTLLFWPTYVSVDLLTLR